MQAILSAMTGRHNMKPKVGSRSLKISHVSEYLQDVLLSLSDGERLPAIRQIMKETGAGQRVVYRVLRGLQDKKLIRIDFCRGIYRICREMHPPEIRLLHWTPCRIDEKNSFPYQLFQKLKGLAAASGREITIENAQWRSPEDLAETLAGQGISRVIVYRAKEPDFARVLQRRMECCLELLPSHNSREVTAMRDSPDMTRKQVDYLLKLGYRRIGYLALGSIDTSLDPLQVLRVLDYYRLMAENGLKVDPDWVFLCSGQFEKLNKGVERIMNTDPRPEVLIASGSVLSRLYPWCKKHRIRIGRDLAVFSCDDYNEHYTPEPTSITNNPERIAETFWEMFQAAERGGKVESRYTELFIRTGLTVPHRKTAGK